MTTRRLWLGLAVYAAAAVASLVLVDPGGAPDRWPTSAAVAVGTATGCVLFSMLARARPRPTGRLALACVLVAAAAAEEVVWRRLVLGGLAERVTPLLALPASSVLFACAHPHARATHVVTGTTFGALYLLSGDVLSACCAHGAYNLAVAGTASRPRPSPGAVA